MSPVVVWSVFAGLTALLCVLRPTAGRLFLGIFFCVMAIGVNLTIAITDPNLFIDLVDGAQPGFYRTIVTAIVGFNPRLFGIAAALVEIGIGLLILSKGRARRAGLMLGIVVLLGISPLGKEERPNLIIAAGVVYLLHVSTGRPAQTNSSIRPSLRDRRHVPMEVTR